MTEQDRDAQNDYLWDGTGEPDPGVVRLEETLRPLAPPRRAAAAAGAAAGASVAAALDLRPWLAAAAALVLVAGGAWFALVLAAASLGGEQRLGRTRRGRAWR